LPLPRVFEDEKSLLGSLAAKDIETAHDYNNSRDLKFFFLRSDRGIRIRLIAQALLERAKNSGEEERFYL
jgi:hypothetical protein